MTTAPWPLRTTTPGAIAVTQASVWMQPACSPGGTKSSAPQAEPEFHAPCGPPVKYHVSPAAQGNSSGGATSAAGSSGSWA